MPPPPTELGKYRLLRKIATGGMAEVYLARTSGPGDFQKTLVLKRILPHLAEDAAFVEMFLNEARLAALLNHPNIVQIFELGEADGSYFIAMEFIDGPNLRALCRKATESGKVVPLEHSAKIISLACEGLNYAHDFADNGAPLNLIHRDISPDNVLISRQGAVKVVDFGIAKAANQGHITKTGTLKGKLAYMPPEQLRGKPLDRRADVFALGVVLYEMIAGMKPFDATSEIAAMQAILHDPPMPLNERRPDCPAELVIIVERALEKDRENRYPDCRAMQRDIEQFLISRRKSIGAYELAQLVVDIVPPTPIPVQPPPSPSSPGREIEELSAVRIPTPKPGPSARRPAPPPPPATVVGLEEEPEGLPKLRPPSRGGGFVGALVGALVVAGLVGGYFALTYTAPAPAGPDAARTAPPAGPDAAEAVVAAGPDASAAGLDAAAIAAAGPDASAPRERPKPPQAGKDRKPDAGVAVAAPKPLPPVDVPKPDAPKLATLAIDTDPPCSVTLDGAPVGQTPVEIKGLAVGAHQVTLTNREKNLTRQMAVSLNPGEDHRERIKFATGTLVFRVQPWAFVEVDDKPQGQTPIPDGVQVYEGEHKVRLFNPELKKELIKKVLIRPGAKETVKVNLLDE